VDDVVRVLIYTHNPANANTAEVHEASTALSAAVELIVEQGVVHRGKFDALRRSAAGRLRREFIDRGMAVAIQEFGVSKYESQSGVRIDRESHIHVCKATCCKLPLALSKEDVQEGVVRWGLDQAYMIARDQDNHCAHLEKSTCLCTVYEHRPIPCRGYDRRNDKRIWLDFENRVVNPQICAPDWPAGFEPDSTHVVAEKGYDG
jgi:hypothetical protein